MSEEFSKYERARILGARALQISMNAPLLAKLNKEKLEELHYDPLKVAEFELDGGVLPISVNRPLPARKEGDIEKIKIKEEVGDEKKLAQEEREVKEIAESSEIMELANPEDEQE